MGFTDKDNVTVCADVPALDSAAPELWPRRKSNSSASGNLPRIDWSKSRTRGI